MKIEDQGFMSRSRPKRNLESIIKILKVGFSHEADSSPNVWNNSRAGVSLGTDQLI